MSSIEVTLVNPQSRRITRSDVARAAGTSVAVVSYVINNGPRPVAPATK
ncbi:LacI family regulatory protein [Yersinia enterocolitica subsp. palearctica YE-150]|nr:LacI family regulatory protein [Yersinia enterocolitica subsp. palearctica YE-150]